MTTRGVRSSGRTRRTCCAAHRSRPSRVRRPNGPPQRLGLDGAAALQEPPRAPLRVAPSAAAPAPPEPDIAEPRRNPVAQTDETESGTKRGGRRSSNNAPPPPLPAAPTGARQHALVTAPAEAQPQAQGYGHLLERTVVVISASRPDSSGVRVSQLVEHFADVVRAVQVIPFDAHLAEGSEVDLERMSRAARDAFVDLAALVADDFPVAAGRHQGPVQGR